MRVDLLNQFLSGATMMGWCVAGLFFLRFWKKSHDRLFLMFAIAFFLLGVNRCAIAFSHQFAISSSHQAEYQPFLYTIRLIAFLIILVAIIDKNRSRIAH